MLTPPSAISVETATLSSPKILVLTHHAARLIDMLMIERKCGKAIKIPCTSVADALSKISTRAEELKGINLIFLEANLGEPSGERTTISAAMLQSLFDVFPGVHIHFFSAGTRVKGITELLAPRVTSGVGEANFGTVTVPPHLCSPIIRKSSTASPAPRRTSIGVGGGAAVSPASTGRAAPAPHLAARTVEIVAPPKKFWCCYFRESARIMPEPRPTAAAKYAAAPLAVSPHRIVVGKS